jgi:flagellar basal body-associated protein FliL
MRTLKIILLVVVVLAVVVLAGIGYVWRELAFTSHTIAPITQPSDTTLETVPPTIENESAPEEPAPSPTVTPITEPITVTVDDLPEGQRAVLETLGMDDASITITPAMVSCAIEALGAARVAEIQAGGAPSISEALTLIACMKK